MSDYIVLRLPKPPALNHLYRTTSRGITYMSTEGKKYKALAGSIATHGARKQGWELTLDPVCVYGEVSQIRGDLDNRAKVLLDSLTGVLWQDDKQVIEAHWRVRFVHHRADEHVLLFVERAKGGQLADYFTEWVVRLKERSGDQSEQQKINPVEYASIRDERWEGA